MTELNLLEILDHLPHRYPFLLIDRVVECIPGKSLIGFKNVTYNEPYFVGHFPQRPVMPGVLILEALAQATGILAFRTAGRKPEEGTLYYLVGIDKARFRRPVEPGDQLQLEVNLIRYKQSIWKFKGYASVDGEEVASAILMCADKGV